MADGTSLTIRQLERIALKVPADRRTVAKVLRGEQLPHNPHKQAAIIRIAKRNHPTLTIPCPDNAVQITEKSNA